MTSGRATHDQLLRLWRAVLDHLLDKLENPPPEGLKASFLAVVVHFLRDNGVINPSDEDAAASSRNALLDKLRQLKADSPQ